MTKAMQLVESMLLCLQHVDAISEGQATIAQKLFEEALVEGKGHPQSVVEYLRKVVLR